MGLSPRPCSVTTPGGGIEREAELTEAFVQLADTLVNDFDVVEFLELLTRRCADILGADAVGVLLSDRTGKLTLAVASSKQLEAVELFQLQRSEGPCWDAFHLGEQVIVDDLSREGERWPTLAPRALEAGFASVHAFPMRLRDERLGSMNMFSAKAEPLSNADVRVGQALADIATISILQDRAAQQASELSDQLQYALDSRVTIEQAKGLLAARHDIGPDEAFDVLRDVARRNRRQLRSVAEDLLDEHGKSPRGD